MNVLVLCGGAGTRATHLPPGTPKFLTPVGGTTVGDLLLGYLGRQGATSVVLACAVGREAILKHTQGRTYPFALGYDLRPEARGTVQAIRWALGARLAPGVSLNPPLVVVNGDTLLGVPIANFVRHHGGSAGMTIAYEYYDDLASVGIRILGVDAVAEILTSEAKNIEDHAWSCGVRKWSVPTGSFLDVGAPAGVAAAAAWVREHCE